MTRDSKTTIAIKHYLANKSEWCSLVTKLPANGNYILHIRDNLFAVYGHYASEAIKKLSQVEDCLSIVNYDATTKSTRFTFENLTTEQQAEEIAPEVKPGQVYISEDGTRWLVEPAICGDCYLTSLYSGEFRRAGYSERMPLDQAQSWVNNGWLKLEKAEDGAPENNSKPEDMGKIYVGKGQYLELDNSKPDIAEIGMQGWAESITQWNSLVDDTYKSESELFDTEPECLSDAAIQRILRERAKTNVLLSVFESNDVRSLGFGRTDIHRKQWSRKVSRRAARFFSYLAA